MIPKPSNISTLPVTAHRFGNKLHSPSLLHFSMSRERYEPLIGILKAAVENLILIDHVTVVELRECGRKTV